jgi:hypothetical protein
MNTSGWEWGLGTSIKRKLLGLMSEFFKPFRVGQYSPCHSLNFQILSRLVLYQTKIEGRCLNKLTAGKLRMVQAFKCQCQESNIRQQTGE